LHREREEVRVIDISMEMEQHDCPFIDSTLDRDVSFAATQWEFDAAGRELETRMVVEGDDRDALDNGLEALRAHPNMHSYTLQKRWDDTAHIRTTIDETDAMGRIRANDGYITGPFYIEDGSERWHVGFDDPDLADNTLAELERNNEFIIVSRRENGPAELRDFVQNASAGLRLIDACRGLTTVERQTLELALDQGYFQSPRGTTLGSLADQFDVSKPAVSKNLRRGQLKVARGVVDALEYLDRSDRLEDSRRTDRDDGEPADTPGRE
jgi:predicted DNA binding protein